MINFDDRFLTTETLYVDDLSMTSSSFIAYRSSHELLVKHDVDIDPRIIVGVIDAVISKRKEHLHPHEVNGMDFYTWELLWLCSPEIVMAIGEVILGHEVDEFWYFHGFDDLSSLFAVSALHTIKLMKSDFKSVTGDNDPLETLMQSFLNGDEGGQAVTKMFRNGSGLKLVH